MSPRRIIDVRKMIEKATKEARTKRRQKRKVDKMRRIAQKPTAHSHGPENHSVQLARHILDRTVTTLAPYTSDSLLRKRLREYETRSKTFSARRARKHTT